MQKHCLCAGEAGRADAVPVGGVYGVFGGLGSRPHTALCALRASLGRLIACAGYHVLVRHLCRHALLLREINGKVHRNTASDVLHDVVYMLQKCYLPSKCATVSRYTRSFFFIYVWNKVCMAFHTPIFTELTNAQQNYVRICCTKFLPYRTMNVEGADRRSFTP